MTRLTPRLFAPVDIGSLVAFRIMFGAILVWEVGRYFSHGWIKRFYIEPTFYFTYYGFGWVRPWPGEGMYLHFAVLGLLAFCITIGLFYRLSTVLFFLSFTYVFLLDQTQYLNHFYLVSILAFLLIFVPAHRAFSVEALLVPARRSDTAPAWALWALRAQLGLVYFYAGVAKLNADWFAGEPMRTWLARRTGKLFLGIPVGRLFTEEWVVCLFCYGGILLDIAITPLLLWRRTRPYAFAAGVLFHLTNAWLFEIGIFPWFAIAGTLLFFSPDWPRRVFKRLRFPVRKSIMPASAPRPGVQWAIVGLLSAHLLIQLLTPLRHWLYPGNVGWTEEGHRFSWHMKLRDKAGKATFEARDPATGRTWTINPREYLSARQASKMSVRPDMILQFCHMLADQHRRSGRGPIEVRAKVMASLNDRTPQPLIDSNVNLAAEPRTLAHAKWILPLEQPLPAPQQHASRSGTESDD